MLADGVWRRGAIVAGAVALLSACTPYTRITTNKDQNFTREIKRLTVVNTIGKELGKYTASYETTLAQGLKDCGVLADIIDRTPQPAASLSLDNSVANHDREVQAQRIRQFAPDSTLQIAQVSHVTDNRNGLVLGIIYALELDDLQLNKPVWKAQVNLATHFDLIDFGDAGATLAQNILERLKQDQILRACPAPAAK